MALVTPDFYAVKAHATVRTHHILQQIKDGPKDLRPSQTMPTIPVIDCTEQEKHVTWALVFRRLVMMPLSRTKPDRSFQYHHQPFRLLSPTLCR
jgi:hypothetical protein